MPTKLYVLTAGMDCPQFEPVARHAGQWWGVAAVDDPKEQDRLEKAGCIPATQEEYETQLKKKAGLPSSLEMAKPLVNLGKGVTQFGGNLLPAQAAKSSSESKPASLPHTQPHEAKPHKTSPLNLSDIGKPVPIKPPPKK